MPERSTRFGDAVRGLRENPLYRLERRRLWRGAAIPLVLLGVLCFGCAFWTPFLLAPALAAMAVVRDKRARIWEELLLTSLSAEEIVLGKLVPVLTVSSVLILLGFGLNLGLRVLSVSVIRVIGGPHRLDVIPLGAMLLAFAVPALFTIAAALTTGGLTGLRCGLYCRDSFNAVAASILFTTLLEGVLTILSIAVAGHWGLDWQGSRGSMRLGLQSAFWLGALTFTLANALLALLLWRSCLRGVRPAA